MKEANWQDRISINPNVCHGKPCIKGTRIPVYLIVSLVAEGETVVLQQVEVAALVIAGESEEKEAAAHALELVGRLRPDVGEADFVEDTEAVGQIFRVVLVAEERADVAGHESVVDLALEQDVLDQLPQPDAGLPLGKVDVEGGKAFLPLVGAGRALGEKGRCGGCLGSCD